MILNKYKIKPDEREFAFESHAELKMINSNLVKLEITKTKQTKEEEIVDKLREIENEELFDNKIFDSFSSFIKIGYINYIQELRFICIKDINAIK